MKSIYFSAIVILSCVNLIVTSPLMQLLENEDEILAKDVISISNESKSSSDESSSNESNSDESKASSTTETTTIDFSRYETRLHPISSSAISKLPFLQDELKENFSSINGTQESTVQTYSLLSVFNLPWLASLSFHRQSSAEQEIISDVNVTVSGELFESDEENDTTLADDGHDESTQSIVQNSTTSTTTIVTTSPTTVTTKKLSTTLATNSTTIGTTTESIKKQLIEKIAEIAAEPIILTQGVR